MAQAYYVDGLVSFGYYDFESKTGDTVSTTEYFVQDYRANLRGTIWDPRFMKFNAGIGYLVYSYKDSPDSDMITYSLATTFFPGKRVSWDIYGSKSVQNIESTSSVVGRDVVTSTYGGTINLNLSKIGTGRFNNNNNNFGNGPLTLPNITLSRNHTESETLGDASPIHEARDNTRASIYYNPGAGFNLNLNSGIESYENIIDNTAYETKTTDLLSNIAVSSYANLRLNGNITDRETSNITGYANSSKSWQYGANLDFKEINRFRHSYSHSFGEQEQPTSDLKTQRTSARVYYRVIDFVEAHGGVDYGSSEYFRAASATDPGEKNSLRSESINAGASYRRSYNPEFLRDFMFETGYSFNYGYADYSTQTGVADGAGAYYTNDVSLGLSSRGWEKETLSLYYSYNNKRDDSPINNDMWQQSYRLNVNTRRITRTTLRGSASYSSVMNKSEISSVYLTSPTDVAKTEGEAQQRRTYNYDLGADHVVNSYLTLNAGAVRGQTVTNYYTLSTLTPISSTTTRDTMYYAGANYFYPITRRLIYRLQLREEFRSVEPSDIQSHSIGMSLDYRIRSIFINIDYRFRQDIPDQGLRSEQQYYFAKLTRPF